jgi:NADPH:quinone reductase-like Zn-dependent oxidoreductase
MILIGTNGAGVDFVLNSLSEDKLQASLRCLGMNGTFLEIGKYDIMNKTKFDMGLFAKRINFKAVFFDDLPVESEEIKVSSEMFSIVPVRNSLCFRSFRNLLTKTSKQESSNR